MKKCDHEYEESRVGGSVVLCWRSAYTHCQRCKRAICVNHIRYRTVDGLRDVRLCPNCDDAQTRAEKEQEVVAQWQALYANAGLEVRVA